MEVFADVLGFIGVVLLAVPALHVNKYALLMARLANAKVRLRDDELAAKRDEVLKALATLRDDWKPWKAQCLLFGTIFAGLSYLVPVLAAICRAIKG